MLRITILFPGLSFNSRSVASMPFSTGISMSTTKTSAGVVRASASDFIPARTTEWSSASRTRIFTAS
jgi:hypothetical protein